MRFKVESLTWTHDSNFVCSIVSTSNRVNIGWHIRHWECISHIDHCWNIFHFICLHIIDVAISCYDLSCWGKTSSQNVLLRSYFSASHVSKKSEIDRCIELLHQKLSILNLNLNNPPLMIKSKETIIRALNNLYLLLLLVSLKDQWRLCMRKWFHCLFGFYDWLILKMTHLPLFFARYSMIRHIKALNRVSLITTKYSDYSIKLPSLVKTSLLNHFGIIP